MNDTLKIFTIIASILPLLQSVIKIVEAFPNLTGSQKKDQALNLIESVVTGLQNNPAIKIKELDAIPFAVVKPMLSTLIDVIVGAFNAVGIFTKSS